MSRERDLELSSKVSQGDHGAFEELLGNLRPIIRGRVAKAVGCYDAAEDITQQAILNAYLKIDNFRGDSAFASWLYSIATNCIRMHFRAQVRHGKKRERLVETNHYELVDLETPLDGAELNEVCAILRESMMQLPDKYRVVIQLWTSGMTLLDMADYLGISRTAIKSQMHRARRHMKTYILEKYGKPALKEIF